MNAVLCKKNELLYRHAPLLWTAVNHHITHRGEHLTFVGYPFLKDIYLDQSRYMVVKKSTQCGVSEFLIVTSINKANAGRSVLYVLPTFDLKNQFVKDRFDRTIGYTGYYRTMLKAGLSKFSESASLKHIGRGAISFVGSNTPNAFISFAADDVVVDEMDRCDQTNLPMARERISNSMDPRTIKVSNPTVESAGIDEEFLKSDMKEWTVQCPGCRRWIVPDFFKHVVKEQDGAWVIRDRDWERGSRKDIQPICDHCGKPFNRYSQTGRWMKTAKSDVSGYHVSKMFSSRVTLEGLVDAFGDGLTNDTKLQRFYNGDLGLAYTAKGSRIEFADLDACRRDYYLQQSSDRPCIMGVDVGSVMHYSVGEILPTGETRVVLFGTAREEEEIYDIARRFKVAFGAMDALPETRLSRHICSRLKGFFMVYYGDVKSDTVNPMRKIVTANRTASLDEVKSAIMREALQLPANARTAEPLVMVRGSEVSEFYQNVCASTRYYDERSDRYDWIHSEPDHHFHGLNYMLIAGKLLASARRT